MDGCSLAVCSGMADRRAGFYREFVEGRAQICTPRRSDRCRDHMDRDQEYGGTGTGEGSASDCNLAVDRSVRNRTSRIVRSRQRTTGNP